MIGLAGQSGKTGRKLFRNVSIFQQLSNPLMSFSHLSSLVCYASPSIHSARTNTTLWKNIKSLLVKLFNLLMFEA